MERRADAAVVARGAPPRRLRAAWSRPTGARGRGIAQGYGHAILPLCDDHDLRTQVRWGLADFRHRFGRVPEGMWMPETAVSERVLAVLAEEGVRFTIVAPAQLRAVRPLEGDEGWSETCGDHGEPLGARAHRPPVPLVPPGPPRPRARPRRLRRRARAAAGLRRPERGGHRRLGAGARRRRRRAWSRRPPTARPSATTTRARTARCWQALTTDGVRARGDRRPASSTCSPSAAATHQAVVRTSAWSCAHGVGRWMDDCGCHTGGAARVDPGVAGPAAPRARPAPGLGVRRDGPTRRGAPRRPVAGP